MDAETKKEFEKLSLEFATSLAKGLGGLTKDIEDLTVVVKESFDAMDVRMDTLENKVDTLIIK